MTGQDPQTPAPAAPPQLPLHTQPGRVTQHPAGARASDSTAPAGIHGNDGRREVNDTVKVDVVKNPCPQCGAEVPPKRQHGGRPKVYCSRRCCAKAARRRQEGVPTRPVARSRRPLPDFARDSGWRLRGDIERIERIFADDRLPAYKHQVAAQLRGHLKYAAEVCQDLLSRIDNPAGG